jgi:multidrug efflux pump subunit AcrB
VLSLSIQRAQGYSDLTVYEGAEEKLRALEERNPGVKFELLSTNANEVEDSYKQSMTTLFEGALLAVVVVFLFLRDWRATIISAVAIPLSAIPTFFFMDLLGFSLNGMTLLALSLVAGVLVDDAIVEIENIVRHMRMGKNAYQASVEAADEIGLAVVATTFSIVAVFLPVGFMPGVPGQYFKNFGFTVVAAVLISLAVARMITPMMAAYLLKPHGQAPHGEGRVMNGYMAVLRWTLKHRWTTVVGGFLSLAATVFMFMALPSAFFPPEDMDEVTFNVFHGAGHHARAERGGGEEGGGDRPERARSHLPLLARPRRRGEHPGGAQGRSRAQQRGDPAGGDAEARHHPGRPRVRSLADRRLPRRVDQPRRRGPGPADASRQQACGGDADHPRTGGAAHRRLAGAPGNHH